MENNKKIVLYPNQCETCQHLPVTVFFFNIKVSKALVVMLY